jgi:hypothetical protein
MSRQTRQERLTRAVWHAMMGRCYKPYYENYKFYGAKGTRVCARWHDCEAFIADMGLKPDGLTLERKDGNADYGPDNCVWATQAAQARNRDDNVMLTHNGRTMCVKDWARELGINPSTIRSRVQLDLPIEEILFQGRLRAKQ